MDRTIRPIKRVIMSRAKPSSLALPASRETSNKTSQVKTPATAIATKAVTGRPNPVCAAESVMTPVIVPGLAAKRINGVNDAPEFEDISLFDDMDPRPLSMEKPIHARTPPPATMKASRDTPNKCSSWVPMSAEDMRITAVADAALVASTNCSRRVRVPSIRANIAPQIAGFTSDSTVTMAWSCSFTIESPYLETVIMLVVLGLIDVVMISNLLIMVIVGGYETFVST